MPRVAGDRRASSRSTTQLEAVLFVVGETAATRPGVPAVVFDLSHGGAGALCAAELEAGDMVLLLIVRAGDQRLFECEVRSCTPDATRGYRVGLKFHKFVPNKAARNAAERPPLHAIDRHSRRRTSSKALDALTLWPIEPAWTKSPPH
jgi:c-di-GMP-binding flagellar brake protein YcgR